MNLDLTTPAGLMYGLGPDLFVMAGAMMLMLVSAFLKDRQHAQRTVGVVAIAVCVSALGLVVLYAVRTTVSDTGPIAVDPFRWAIDAVILLGAIGAIALAIDGNERERILIPEVHVLLLLATSGMMMLAAARDLMVVFLAIELMSLSVYVLAGLDRKSAKSAESALKYFLLGSFSTGFLLYGIALVYGATGSTDIGVIGAVANDLSGTTALFHGGIALLLIGFAFKVSAVPFHMWAPDVYEGAPTPITAYMSVAVKAAAFAAWLRVWTEAFQPAAETWRAPLIGVAMATMLVGSLVALRQTNVKRMLAYSSIVHSGYILIAVLVASEIGRGAFLFYLLSYTLASLGSFAIVAAISKPNDAKLALADYAGLWHERPWLAISMGIYLLALLGFPFFGGTGFIAKWYLLNASLAGPTRFTGVASVLVVSSVISAGFYLYLVTLMFMKERPAGERVLRAGGLTRAVIVTTAVAVLVLGVVAGPMVRWAERGARIKGGVPGTVRTAMHR